LEDWIGKRIFVKLSDGAVYSGIVLDFSDGFFSIKDKFGERVMFPINRIGKIVEESNGN